MNILIVEDEQPAADRLERLLKQHNASINIIDKIDTVKKTVEVLQDQSGLDLIFMDIQLADGLSFEIFDHIEIKVPVIFTTAYDEYALQAFKVNSIDYLLKPIDDEEIEAAFKKYDLLTASRASPHHTLDQISKAMSMLTRQYKNRFVVKVGEHIKSIAVSEIDYFFSRDKATYCSADSGKNFILDYSLEQVEGMMDPEVYFRINRKYLISLPAIQDIISYSNSRLRVVLKNCDDQDVIVSRERVADFKSWLEG